MKNLLLFNWKLIAENGEFTPFAWASLVLIAVVVFSTIMFLIYRLSVRNVRGGKKKQNNDNALGSTNASFEKRSDNQLEFYDPSKAREEALEIERAEEEKRRQEEERLQALMLEEERKRKELEAKERAFEEKQQREEELRLQREQEESERRMEKERRDLERQAEKERIRAEKEAAKNEKKNSNNDFNSFFSGDDSNENAFSFVQDDNESNDAVDFFKQVEDNQNDNKVISLPMSSPALATTPVSDPRLEKILEELENQKQNEQTRFANLMAELEQQKQETARLQGELNSKAKSEDIIAQAKKEMEQMIKDSQEKINNLERNEQTKKNKAEEDKNLLQEIKNVLAVEREAQEQRLREQENSLAAVLNAMENERRIKEQNALNAEQETKKENEFIKMQNQYQDAILQMQERFQQMLADANAQKNVVSTDNQEAERNNVYQMQLERERAETVTLIEQMQREVDRMNSERETERREYAEKQKALDVTLAEALETQRHEFELAQQRASEANVSSVERLLQDFEKQREQEQAMFNGILNELAAEREDHNHVKSELEQMVRESEARIEKLENQSLPRGLDEESMNALKEVLAIEREEQTKRMGEYKVEIANLLEVIANEKKNNDSDDEGNQTTYEAKDVDVDNEINARIDAMQDEIRKLNEERKNEIQESEKRHAELLEALNRTIVTGENAEKPETQQTERESVDRVLNEIAERNRLEEDRFANILTELAENRKDAREAQMAMQQLVQESFEMINQLSNKKEIRGVDDETMSALKDLLAHEREMQEKRLAEHEERLNLAVSTIEEQKLTLADEDDKQAEYEQMIADLRAQYESELSSLRDTIANQQALEKVQIENENSDANNDADQPGDNGNEMEYDEMVNEEVLAQLARLQENIAALEKSRDAEKAEYEQRYNNLNKVLEESLKVQRLEMELAKEREINELKMQQALDAQRHEIEIAQAQALEEQRLQIENAKEQELAKQREALEVAREQALAEQREAIEAVKTQVLAEQREMIEAAKAQALAEKHEEIKAAEQELASQSEAMEVAKAQLLAEQQEALEIAKAQALAEKEQMLAEKEQALIAQRNEIDTNVNEQTNAIVATFKEEMNRQYEEFLRLLNEKKASEEAAQKEYEELVKQTSAADQAALDEQQYNVQEMMEQLREERRAARAEAQALREELEAQRIETEARLMKQLSEVKEGLVSELSSELEIKEKFEAMEREIDAQNQEKIKQNEEEEARIKQEYEEFKQKIANEVVALEEKNASLQAELEKARAEKNVDDQVKQAEYDENEKRLREKYIQLRNELLKEAEQVNKQSEEIIAEKQAIEEKKNDLEEEKARLQNEVAMLKQQVLEIKTNSDNQENYISENQLAEIRASLEAEYQQREKEMLDKLEIEKQSLLEREAQLKEKESNIEKEEERIREQSKAVTTMITNREYTKEERERMVLDYSLKLQDLEERLRQNEKALRENNREFIPLRRIKNTLERDLRVLRKREAIVAKQEVLVYGVNNISSVDPEKIEKLEQDIKQLTGLQQSVANCETILNKNKDRYPTLENLDHILRAQNEQIRHDLEEVKAGMAMFGEDASNGDVQA